MPDKEKKKLVYPWDDSAFPGSAADKISVYDNLRKRKYPLKNMQAPPHELILKAVNLITLDFLVKDSSVLVLSNSPRLLQALANFCPVIYSLTTMYSCINVTNESLTELFIARRPTDEFAEDPIGDAVRVIAKSGLLVWEDLGDRFEGSIKVSAKFTQLLKKRNNFACSSLFTMVYEKPELNEAGWELVKNSIVHSIGDTAFEIITENAEVVHLPIKRPDALEEMLVIKLEE